ncbi:hypothetical protein J6A31_05465, partial [bacterium]|nr:hypothetical protein [bacterium]
MERIKFFSVLFLVLLLQNVAVSEPAGSSVSPNVYTTQQILNMSTPSLSTLVTPQNVPFEECTRVFNVDSDNLFFLTVA